MISNFDFSTLKGELNKLLLIFLFCFSLQFASAQTDNPKPGKITVYADPKLNENIYMKKFLANPGKETEIQGFRIQIYIGTDRNEANHIKNQFTDKYPETESYLIYDSPNFKVRIGNFRNKIEAQKLLHDLKEKYDGAFIVPDKIKFPKL